MGDSILPSYQQLTWLATFSKNLPPKALHTPQLSEPLTERELEVLRLLAAGRSNQDIAEELIIAVGTVKRHINSIMGKLPAQSRLEAVARARDLHLV